LNQESFRDDYSNNLTFKKVRVLSPLVNPDNFSVSIERLRQQEKNALLFLLCI
jgi:hypothetical protein